MDERERQRRRERFLVDAFRVRTADARLKLLFDEPEREITFWQKQEEMFGLTTKDGEWVGTEAALRWVFQETEREHPPVREVKATPEYSKALGDWRRAMRRFYSPEFYAAINALSEGSADGVELALLFLEADPWCFRSGYTKQNLLRHLLHVQLDEEQLRRLREVLVSQVRVGTRMEFREACRTARVVDTPSFRRRLRALRDQPLHGAGARQRAAWMLDALVRANGE